MRRPRAKPSPAKHTEPPRSPTADWPRYILPTLVTALTFACFAPALQHDFVNWDDPLNFSENPHYRGLAPNHLRWMFTTFHMGHYQPLSWLTLGLDYTLWGMDAGGYHLTNVVLHTINALLFYWLTIRLLRLAVAAPRAEAVLPAAAIGALFFAIHPLRVETVAWVTERRDVLSGLFYLATVLAYLRWHAAPQPSPARRRWHIASIAFLVLSLLSKAWGMTLPLVLLAIDAFPLRRVGREPLSSLLIEKIPHALAAVAAALLAIAAQSQGAEMATLEQHSLLARLGQAAYGLCFYLAKTAVPLWLTPLYPLAMDGAALLYLVAGVAVLAITAGAIATWRRWPWLAIGWGCYGIIVSPVLGLVQTGPQIAADRYTYLACLPWAVVVAAGSHWLIVRKQHIVLAAVGVGLLGFALLTVQQTRLWHDSPTLWNHALKLNPDNAVAYVNRGTAYEEAGNLDRALADFNTAIAHDPGQADAYFGRANVRRVRGDLSGALADFDTFTRLRPNNPMGYANRGGVRHLQGDLAGARADYQRALELAAWDWPFRSIVTGNLAELDKQR